jgi:AraC family transcriptional regulator, ethanolamine operon transcriptional activator
MSELHPSDVVLLALAAGTLDEVQRVAIDDHVRGCARCRAFVRAMEHVGGIVLGRLPPTPLANELLLSAQLDQRDAFLFPHWVPFRSEGTLRLAPTFSDYAHNVHDVEVNFLLTEGSERDWSIRRCTLTDIALQFGRTGASTIADGIADRSDAIVFAIQSSMLSDHVIMNGQKASASDIAVLPPGCDFIFTGRAAYDWISIILPIKNLPSVLVDYVREPIEKGAAARITTKQSRCRHLVRVAAKTIKSKLQRADSSAACLPESTEEELIDALSRAVTSAKDCQVGPRRHDSYDSYQVVRQVLSAARESQPIHVADLCHLSSLKERTLACAFTNVFNISPARYLKLRLLNNIHKSLLAPEARGQQVADILMSGGVIELDEFTTEYCLLFGETPCQTQQRSQPYN